MVPGGFQEFGQALLDAVGEYVEIWVSGEVAGDPNVALPQYMKIEAPVRSVVAVRRARLGKR